jgi:hypothetical protein
VSFFEAGFFSVTAATISDPLSITASFWVGDSVTSKSETKFNGSSTEVQRVRLPSWRWSKFTIAIPVDRFAGHGWESRALAKDEIFMAGTNVRFEWTGPTG